MKRQSKFGTVEGKHLETLRLQKAALDDAIRAIERFSRITADWSTAHRSNEDFSPIRNWAKRALLRQVLAINGS